MAALSASSAVMAETPLWLRDAKIAPDGKTIAFTYKGDIWTVPVAGGEARRLTSAESYETTPIWSPDSKNIAFASDRHGSFDVFVMSADGGKPTRLTFNSSVNETPESFSPDGKSVIYSAAIQVPAQSAAFPTSRLTQLYEVPMAGGASKQILATPAQMMTWDTAKTPHYFLYQDVKGFEDEWRKHHTSSVTREIWKYDVDTKRHTNLTNHPGEDRNPVAAGDKFYFLSERNGGSMNVYVAPMSNPSDAKAVTSFKTHPVRFLSRANDGRLCFTYNGELYTLAEGGKPVKVAVNVVSDDSDDTVKLPVRSGAREAVASPDGKSMAFTYRGEVYVTSVEYSTTKQITNTAQAEGDVVWAPDGKSLYYTSERDGKYNIYKAEMGRPDDEPNFANATVIKETALFSPDSHERAVPQISPDGKKMAFILDRNKLAVMDLKSKKVTELTDGSNYPTRNGKFTYTWSPDSRWIAMEISPRKHDPYYDIAVVNVETGEITDITNTGYFDENPKWVLGGNAIAFISERYGMRNHASWGSEYDVMLAFLNQDAYDKFCLSEEDYAIRKDLDKKAEKKDAKSDKKDDKKKSKKGDDKAEADSTATKDKAIDVDLTRIADRTVRVTPISTAIRDYAFAEDGETLYYLVSGDKGAQLWKLKPRKGDHSMVTRIDGASSFGADKDNSTLFVYGSSINKLDPKSDKLTGVSYSSTLNLDPAAEREYMFDFVEREERERFYDAKMHGVNWDMMTDNYRKFLPYINNNYDFTEMLSELLGELNVSHTGARYNAPSQPNDERTGSLGLLFDMTYTGPGLKVAEVITGGPFDRANSKVIPGSIIKAINGTDITASNDYSTLLTDLIGKKTLVSISDGKNSWDEVILPISNGKVSNLLYDRWVKNRAADVDRWSNGRLGYVHIRSMDDASFRKVYSDLLGKYNDREGVVIDVRWNGGGRLHEDIEVLFSGEKYFTQEVRGTETCDMPSRRWNKPSIMVIAEPCYSNAHGTPWVYKHRGIGKLVGMPVPGTMTSVNWVTLQDPTMYFGIPVTGYRLPDGSVLENQQLEPDIRVSITPEDLTAGNDTQLKAAVDELLRELPAKKK